jgi:hypothetical protein
MEEKYTEILRLKEMLEKEGIPFVFRPQFDGYTIKYDGVCSVIEHFGSYGGDDNLLEIMGLLTKKENTSDNVLGYLTAENVFKRIKKHYKSAPHGECRTGLKKKE